MVVQLTSGIWRRRCRRQKRKRKHGQSFPEGAIGTHGKFIRQRRKDASQGSSSDRRNTSSTPPATSRDRLQRKANGRFQAVVTIGNCGKYPRNGLRPSSLKSVFKLRGGAKRSCIGNQPQVDGMNLARLGRRLTRPTHPHTRIVSRQRTGRWRQQRRCNIQRKERFTSTGRIEKREPTATRIGSHQVGNQMLRMLRPTLITGRCSQVSKNRSGRITWSKDGCQELLREGRWSIFPRRPHGKRWGAERG